MDEQKQILWNFLETAFRTGALDELLDFIHIVTGKQFEDMSQAFAGLEDVFMEMEDTSEMERKFEVFYRVLKELTREDVLEGIGVLLGYVNPLIGSWMDSGGGDSPLFAASRADGRDRAVKALKALKAAGALGFKWMIGSLDGKSPRRAGEDAGRMLNTAAAFANGVVNRDPGSVPDFMAGLFSVMNGADIRRLADTMADGFLDQHPPIFKWTASTALKRARKRIANR